MSTEIEKMAEEMADKVALQLWESNLLNHEETRKQVGAILKLIGYAALLEVARMANKARTSEAPEDIMEALVELDKALSSLKAKGVAL